MYVLSGTLRKAGKEEATWGDSGKFRFSDFCALLCTHVCPVISGDTVPTKSGPGGATQLAFMRGLYHGFLQQLRCGQSECDMSGHGVT